MGAAAVKSRGKTVGAGRTTTLHPAGVLGAGLTAAGIPRAGSKKRFSSRSCGSQPRFPSRAIVTAYIYHYRCIYHASDSWCTLNNFLNEYISYVRTFSCSMI